MNEVFVVKHGVGTFGKLWTGDIPPENSLITFPKIILRSCKHCACTTNQFRCSSLKTTIPETFLSMGLREIWLFSGGVGSLPDLQAFSETLDVPTLLTNWSGRIGGIVLIAPEAVVTGRGMVTPPVAPEGYSWTQVYEGQTLHQWVMLPSSGEIPEDRELEVLCPRGPAGDGWYTCPRCATKNTTSTGEMHEIFQDYVIPADLKKL